MPTYHLSRRFGKGCPAERLLSSGKLPFSMLVLSRLDEVDSPDLDSAITYLPGTDTLQGIAVTRGGNVIHSRSLAIDLLGRTVGVTNKREPSGRWGWANLST